MSSSRFHVRATDMPSYSPANHLGTVNRRLVSRETVGAQNLEVVLGVIEKRSGALPHLHPDIEQACYLLSGALHVEVGEDRFDMVPGDCCFFPAGVPHAVVTTSDEPASLLVIYSPPYEEQESSVVRVEDVATAGSGRSPAGVS